MDYAGFSKSKVESAGLATIVSYEHAGLDPKIMGYGPVPTSKKALERAGQGTALMVGKNKS